MERVNQTPTPIPVYLARTPDYTPRDQFYDNQQVRIKQPSGAILLCSNRDKVSGDNFNFTVRFPQIQNITRTGVNFISFTAPSANVNNRNNTIAIRFTTGPNFGDHFLDIPIGFYSSHIDLANAISLTLAPLSIVCNYNPLTFGFSLVSTSGDLFYILPGSDFIVFGGDTFGFYPNTTPSTQIDGEVAKLIYSRYYTVSCPQLTRYEKLTSSASNNINTDIIATILVDNTTISPIPVFYSKFNLEPVRNFDYNQPLNELTFFVRDCYGLNPDNYTTDPNSFALTLGISVFN